MAERRVCSVLFCDLVGFTPLSESRDPEAVRELLSRYFGVARTVIGRYGGRLADDNTNDLATAIASQREASTPYHLAHGLLDYAQELTRRGETEAAAAAVGEATAIAVQLRCQPLLDRAADLTADQAQVTAGAGARRRTRATGTRL